MLKRSSLAWEGGALYPIRYCNTIWRKLADSSYVYCDFDVSEDQFLKGMEHICGYKVLGHRAPRQDEYIPDGWRLEIDEDWRFPDELPIFAFTIAIVLCGIGKRGKDSSGILKFRGFAPIYDPKSNPKIPITMENLNKLANAQLNGIIETYKGETRDWWNHVDEDAIYEAIGEHEFDVYVRLFVTEDTHYSGARKAV